MAAHVYYSADTGRSLAASFQRAADGLYYDFADATFKASPTTLAAALAEGTGSLAGSYALVIASTPQATWPDGAYVVRIHDAANSNLVIDTLDDAFFGGDDGPAPPNAVSITAQDKADIATATAAAIDVPGALTAQGLTPERAGRLDNLDAAITTRSTYAGADPAGVTELLARLGAPAGASISADLQTRAAAAQIPAAFVDATFASPGVFSAAALQSAPAGGSGGGVSLVQLQGELDGRNLDAAHIDVPIGSRLAGSSYAPAPSAPTVAGAVWAYLIGGQRAGSLLAWIAARLGLGRGKIDGAGRVSYGTPGAEGTTLVAFTPSASDTGTVTLTEPTLGG